MAHLALLLDKVKETSRNIPVSRLFHSDLGRGGGGGWGWGGVEQSLSGMEATQPSAWEGKKGDHWDSCLPAEKWDCD